MLIDSIRCILFLQLILPSLNVLLNSTTFSIKEIEDLFWSSYAANKEYDDQDRIEAYMGHFPHGGVSWKLLDHIGQNHMAD